MTGKKSPVISGLKSPRQFLVFPAADLSPEEILKNAYWERLLPKEASLNHASRINRKGLSPDTESNPATEASVASCSSRKYSVFHRGTWGEFIFSLKGVELLPTLCRTGSRLLGRHTPAFPGVEFLNRQAQLEILNFEIFWWGNSRTAASKSSKHHGCSNDG